jgi:hypothetical protein
MSLETTPISDLRQRKQSLGAIRIIDQSGEKHMVQLDDLTESDRELAEKFGYQPVSESRREMLIYGAVLMLAFKRCLSANLDTWPHSRLLSVSVGFSRQLLLLIYIVSITLIVVKIRLTSRSFGSWWN